MLVIDRKIDPLTPLMHTIYYEAILFDILNLKSNKIDYEVVIKKKDVKSESEGKNIEK